MNFVFSEKCVQNYCLIFGNLQFFYTKNLGIWQSSTLLYTKLGIWISSMFIGFDVVFWEPDGFFQVDAGNDINASNIRVFGYI